MGTSLLELAPIDIWKPQKKFGFHAIVPLIVHNKDCGVTYQIDSTYLFFAKISEKTLEVNRTDYHIYYTTGCSGNFLISNNSRSISRLGEEVHKLDSLGYKKLPLYFNFHDQSSRLLHQHPQTQTKSLRLTLLL